MTEITEVIPGLIWVEVRRSGEMWVVRVFEGCVELGGASQPTLKEALIVAGEEIQEPQL